MNRTVFTLLYLCIGLLAHAQILDKKHLSIGSQLSFGKIMTMDPEVQNVLSKGNSRFYDLSLSYQTFPSDSSTFASSYNFPALGLGFSIADFSSTQLTQHSRLGNIYSLYGFFNRALTRSKYWELGYKLCGGLSYAENPYHPINNPSNIFVSSPLMVYISFGLNVKYKANDRLTLGFHPELKHISNGRLGMPNKGLNMYSLGLSANYSLNPMPAHPKRVAGSTYNKHFYYHLVFGGGVQASYEEWQLFNEAEPDPEKKQKKFDKYPKFSLSGDMMYRYSQKYGIGLGVDLFLTPHVSKLKEWDEALTGGQVKGSYHPLSVGLSLNHEVYFRNLAVSAAFGYYAFRQLGIQNNESKFYQRAGFRYYLPANQNIFVGTAIKAHNFRMAEYLELSIGYKF